MKYLTLLVLLALGCKKDNAGQTDTQPPVVSLLSPKDGQIFTSRQTITVAASITDDKKLKEIHLEIINNTTSALVLHEHYIPDGRAYDLSKTFTPAGNTSYKIKVEAEDGANNSTKQEVNITVN